MDIIRVSWIAAALVLGSTPISAGAQTRAWRTVPATGLPTLSRTCIVHHAGRGHTVLLGAEATNGPLGVFDFDGSSWTRSTAPSGPVPLSGSRCVYDAGRASVFWFGTTATSPGIIQTWELVGTAWINRTTAVNNGNGNPSGAAYHSGLSMPFVQILTDSFSVTQPSFDWAVGVSWASLPANSRALAFDSARGLLVLTAFGSGTLRFYESSGTGNWGAASIVATATFDVYHLVFDANRGVSVGVGLNPTSELVEWNGGATTFTLASGPSSIDTLTYDASRKNSLAFRAADTTVWELGVFASQGSVCTIGPECLSGSCVDGRCCDTPCGGTVSSDCQACSVAAGALTDGVCRTLPNTVTCRASAGACDVAETCSGASSSCPSDSFASASTVCRAANGACDVAESCPGNGPACPVADSVAPNTVVCRPAPLPCDVPENCDGSTKTCPADTLSSGTPCRSSFGPCDVPESCDGVSASCPADAFASVGTICDPAVGVCDAVDHCTGSSAACPEELLVDDTACDDQNVCTQASVCKTGVCTETLRLDCSDSDPCTTDTCQDGFGGCLHSMIPACMGGDAGTDAATLDAGNAQDAGALPPVGAAGCSCHVGSPVASRGGGLVACGLLVTLMRRRRRR